MNRLTRAALVLCVCASSLGAQFSAPRNGAARPARQTSGRARKPAAAAPKPAVPAGVRAALDRISADSLRGHLSFIASDLLEGRNTPSRGLDIAAEYIAAQFRRAGLEPAAGAGSYFQTADWVRVERPMDGFALSVAHGGGETRFGGEQVSLSFNVMGRPFWPIEGALALDGAGVVRVDYADAAAASALTPGEVSGRVVFTEIPDFRREPQQRWPALFRAQDAFMKRMGALGAALVVDVDRARATGNGGGPARAYDPAAARGERAAAAQQGGGRSAPLARLHGAEAGRIYDSLKPGPTDARLTLRVPATVESPARVSNVAGVLRGSDPALRDTYVLVTAHYDHIGTREGAAGSDAVYNGANDDGSGTVSVIELAAALSALNPRPRRSILFMTFFGEEKGLLGSRYYGRHPLVPLAGTVAQINLEQVGRTDDSEGPQVGRVGVTGYDYSDVGATLAAAGEAAGVRFYKHPSNSDAFFGRSDNQALADLGIPAHTLSVAYEFPDYHGLEDEWEKVDYANMARVLRGVGLGVVRIASDAQAPKWNESDPKAARYVEAWRKLHGKGNAER